jgi:hypothetical protein
MGLLHRLNLVYTANVLEHACRCDVFDLSINNGSQ